MAMGSVSGSAESQALGLWSHVSAFQHFAAASVCSFAQQHPAARKALGPRQTQGCFWTFQQCNTSPGMSHTSLIIIASTGEL